MSVCLFLSWLVHWLLIYSPFSPFNNCSIKKPWSIHPRQQRRQWRWDSCVSWASCWYLCWYIHELLLCNKKKNFPLNSAILIGWLADEVIYIKVIIEDGKRHNFIYTWYYIPERIDSTKMERSHDIIRLFGECTGGAKT